MKVGVMGTHGVGKTFFVEQLAQIIRAEGSYKVKVVSEVVRDCPWPINRDVDVNTQRWIFHRHLLTEIEACQEPGIDIVVCDRTAIDALVYAGAAGFWDMVDEYLPAALAWFQTYNRIFWLRPVNGRLEADGFRDPDPEWQNIIDRIFRAWIDVYCIPTVGIADIESAHKEGVASWVKTVKGMRGRA